MDELRYRTGRAFLHGLKQGDKMKNRINRKQYEKIRKMDHQQMSAYFNDVYNEGFVEGIARAENIVFIPDEAERMLRQINGFGNR